MTRITVDPRKYEATTPNADNEETDARSPSRAPSVITSAGVTISWWRSVMTDLLGKLGPLRVTKDDLLEFARELERKLPSVQDSQSLGYYRFSVIVGDYSEDCYNVDGVRDFLRDLPLVNAVTDFALLAYTPSGEGSAPRVALECSSYYARYRINGARNVAQANELRDVFLGFRNRYKTSRLLSNSGAFFLSAVLAITLYLASMAASFCGFSKTFIFDLPCRPVVEYYALIVGCVVLLIYVIWFAWISKNPPRASFHHSILYLDKEPRNIVWQIVLIVDVLVGIIGWIASLLKL